MKMEEIVEKIDSHNKTISDSINSITQKLDTAFKRIESLENPQTNGGGEEASEKLDANTIATNTIRAKLEGFLPKEKLDKMDLIEMSESLARIKKLIKNPQEGAGILNEPHGKQDNASKKLDSFSAALKGVDKDEVVWL